MKKSLMLFVIGGVMLTFTPSLQAESDIFSVNFYAYGKAGAEYWDEPSWRETVTMESGQSAGVGDWNTTGWENYQIPWGLGSPATPVTITSTLGSTATFTLNDVRNGSPYWWTQTRTTLLGDGDGDMMDGHGNGTEDPYDWTAIFDMTVSDITFALYDVIIYIGGNQGQWGDGTGKIVFNGGAEQDFYLGANAEFSGYAEIVDGVTAGNYIRFRGLTASSFTTQIWGNGFNHLGPTGFQIMEVQASPPEQATNPGPAGGATDVWCGTNISWTAGYESESSDVYFGTNPTPGAGESQGNQTQTTFDPGVLAANTTYFWRIDSVNTLGTTTGQVWSFTTNAETPSPDRNTFLVPMTYTGAGWEEFAFLAAIPASAAINDAQPSVIALDETGTMPAKVYEYITQYNPYEAYTIDTTGSLDDVACYLAQTFWTTTTIVVLCDDGDYAGALAASALAGRLEVPLMFFDSATGLSSAALNVIDNDLQCTAALTVNGNGTVSGQLSGIGVGETALADDKAIISWMQNNGLPVEYLAVCNVNDRGMSDYAPKGSLAAALLAAGRNGAVAAMNYATEWNLPFLRSSTTTVKPEGLPANTEPPRKYHDPNDLDYDLGTCTVNGETYDWVVVRMTDGDRLDAAFIDFNGDGDYGDAGEYCPRTCELTINGKRYTFGVNSTQPNPYAWGELRFTYPSDDKFKEDLQGYHDQIGHYPKYMAIVGLLQALPAAHALSYDRGWCDYVMNDNYFADVDADPLYDIATGRIVGENVTYITLNASRCLTYDYLQYPPAMDHVFHQCTEEFETGMYRDARQLENCGFTVDEWLYLPANEYKVYGVFIQDEHGWPFGIARDEFLQNSSWTVCLVEGGGCNMASLDMYYDASHDWNQTNAVVLAREGAVCFNAWVRGTGSGKTVSRDAFYKAISEGASMGEAHMYALNIMTAKDENTINSYDLNANMMYGDPAVTLYRPTAQTYAPANVTANGNTLTVNAPGTYWVDYINSTGLYVYTAPGLAGFTSEAVDGTFFATYTTGLQILEMTQEAGVPSPLGWITMREGQDYVIDEHWDNTRTIYWRVRLEEFDENSGTFNQTTSAIDYTITTEDTLPPTPDPATFASAPAAVSDTEITMTATTGSDVSGPVEYYFDETSGNPGGSDSGWTTDPVYYDTGLTAGTQYTYTVQMRDSLLNTGTASSPASATTGPAGAPVLINVNLDYTARTESTLDGPIYGTGGDDIGTTWNQILGASPSATNLPDANNAATTVGFTCSAGSVNRWGSPDLTLLTGAVFNWVPTDEYTLTISGLSGSETYDVYLAGFHPNENGSRALISTANTTTTVGTQIVDSGGGGGNDSTWVRGENFVVFQDIEPDSSNEIIFTIDSDWDIDNTKRAYLSGFQIATAGTDLIPPGPATNPDPSDGALGLTPDTDLSWTAGIESTSTDVYFGTNPTPGAGEFQGNQTGNTFDPGTLALGTYYWRIDEINGDGTTTGTVWSFTVGPPGKAVRPMPWDGMTAVALDAGVLSWAMGERADSSDVYFGTNPTPGAGEFMGNQTATTYNPGALSAGTTYYWRIDQVNPQGTTTGDVWSFTTPIDSANRVKIFILAGQSNMEGHGEIDPIGTQGTLEYIYDNDPVTYAHLKDGGDWAVRSDAWIWYMRGGTTLVNGGLTAGYGAYSTTIGPELQFGHAMGDLYGEQVLLIKTAWGGKSLAVDFRPPSSGWSVDTPAAAGDDGFYYKEMLDYVVHVMANISTYFPTYNPADGYEIAGFGWHQGWNDRVNSVHSAEYEVNMVNFIKDVRTSLGVPDMPFVIATTGMDGNPDYSEVELAQLAMEDFVTYPEFDGNVAVTDTQSFWRDAAESPADQSYHWNRNAETYYLIGDSMAAEMTTLLGPVADTDPPTPDPATWAIAPSADSDTAISMTATTGSDATGPVEYYFDETSGNPGGTDSGWQTSPSYTDTGLSPSTQYTYTVTMRDAVTPTPNMGMPSSPANATTDPAPAIPAAPSNLSATAVSQTQIDLSWTDNADNETGFKIERSDRNPNNFAEIATVGADVTSFSDTTVRKNTIYYYRVRATNSYGDSAYSNEASAQTPK